MKTITSTSTKTPARHAHITIWFARDAYHDLCGELVTEPGNLDAPVAFIFYDSEKKVADLIRFTDTIAENHELLDRASNTGEFCRMDLRDRGRADSKRAMPGWCYSLFIRPNDEDEPDDDEPGNEEFPWNPFCPIRLAMMLAKRPGAMNSTAVAPKSTTR